MVQIQFGSVIFAEGRFRSHDVARVFFFKTSYRNELNQCGWFHCVQLAKTQKLICILNLFDHHWTLIHVAYGHTLTINFRRQQIHVSMGLDERNNGVRNIVLTFLVQKTLLIKIYGYLISLI